MTVELQGTTTTINPVVGVEQGRSQIWWDVSAADGRLEVTAAQLDAAVKSVIPSASDYRITSMTVEIRDWYLTHCGGTPNKADTALATMTVGGPVSPS
jgi:hypothetical protein